MRIALIVKGNLAKKRKCFEELAVIESHPLFDEVKVLESVRSGQSIELAQQATSNGFDILIAVGGDGTINECLNGMLQAKQDKLPILGSLPFGTANDFASTAGLTSDAKQLIDLIEFDHSRPIDIGIVSSVDQEGMQKERHFINVTDVGIGGYVVEKVNKSKKRLGPNLTFLRAITETFITYEQSEVKLTIDDDFSWQGKVLSLVIANGRSYGSGLQIAPDAELDDGLFNVVTFADVGVKDYVLNLRSIKKGKKLTHPKVFYKTGRLIKIEPIRFSCPAEMDGEYIGYAPLTVTALPGHIRFLLPKP